MWRTTRALFLHAGGGKTGSTALQKVFYECREQLLRDGIRYEVISDTGSFPVSGNGKPLHDAIAADQPVTELIHRYFAGSDRALISSEFFGNMKPWQWDALLASLRELHVETRVVLFARDIYPLYYSQWLQTLKSYQELDFEDFAHKDNFIHKRFFKYFQTERGVHVDVLHYESEKSDLVRPVLRGLGLDPTRYNYTLSIENRSPTAAEIEVFLQVHRALHGTVQTRTLWSAFEKATRYKTDKSPMPTSQPIVCDLEKRHGKQIALINEQFFGGKPVLKILDPSDTARNGRDERDNDVTKIALSWALQKLAERINDCHRK